MELEVEGRRLRIMRRRRLERINIVGKLGNGRHHRPVSEHDRRRFSRHFKCPIFKMSQPFLANRLRTLHRCRSNLSNRIPSTRASNWALIQPHCCRHDRRPTKPLLLERFRKQANTAAIPRNDLHPVGSFRAEDVERSVEGINTAVAHQGHQRLPVSAEVDLACWQHKLQRPTGSCLANRADDISEMIRLDIASGAQHHFTNDNFHQRAAHRRKTLETHRQIGVCGFVS